MFRKKDKNQGIPDGVVGNNLKNARLTKKEREEIATTERKRIRKQMEAEAERYQIIKSTQRIIPVEDIFNGVIITKDHRYVKVMEYRPINFAYMDAETQNRVISLFYQTFKAVPCNIQFKTFARKADVESTISNVTQYYEQETNPKRKKMLNAYIGLLRKTALSVGITRRFFVVIEFQKTISNDGSRFELVVADLNAMAANVRSHMEQCGNVFIPALGNPDRNEDAGIHQLFYQLLNRSKSETVSFHDHMQPIIDRYSEAEMQGVKTSLQAPELIAPEWIDFTHYNYIVIDGKFYTFAYIPSTGYNQRVYAGWIATFVNAGEGIDVDMFFEHMSREAVFAMTQDISQFYEYKGGKYGKAVIGNADTKIIMHLIPSEAKALQAAIQLTDSEMENVSNLGRGQGLVCSGAAKLFVDFIAAPYEKQEITTDAKSFYLQEKALKEKQHKEEQERLAAEKANSNTDANDDDADLLNVTF